MDDEEGREASGREAGVVGDDAESLTRFHQLVSLDIISVGQFGSHLDDTHLLSDSREVEYVRVGSEEAKFGGRGARTRCRSQRRRM